jgi:hypothetical protein
MQTFSVRRVVSAVDRTWENVYPTFSSSLGSTLLLIEKATHDPLYLWVIRRSKLRPAETLTAQLRRISIWWIWLIHLPNRYAQIWAIQISLDLTTKLADPAELVPAISVAPRFMPRPAQIQKKN